MSAVDPNEVDPPLYAARKDWADVTPLQQYENVNPLAPILYSEECKSGSTLGILEIASPQHIRQGCNRLFQGNCRDWRNE